MIYLQTKKKAHLATQNYTGGWIKINLVYNTYLTAEYPSGPDKSLEEPVIKKIAGEIEKYL
jgi:hypothetical protein